MQLWWWSHSPCNLAGQGMLVPLTSSLYVSGTVTRPDKVLIDIGTGYYVEVRNNFQEAIAVDLLATVFASGLPVNLRTQNSTEQGVGYCKRKVNFLREQIQKVIQVYTFLPYPSQTSFCLLHNRSLYIIEVIPLCHLLCMLGVFIASLIHREKLANGKSNALEIFRYWLAYMHIFTCYHVLHRIWRVSSKCWERSPTCCNKSRRAHSSILICKQLKA